MRSKIILCYLLLLFCFNRTYAQTDTTVYSSHQKLGLALSGGGAKGLAHIGLLRMIDSLGIQVDYITGTSMGGILGGLYAMGYPADSIKTIVYNLDWNRVLSNKVPMSKINMEEKDEYEGYAVEFPVEKGVPLLPTSLIEGQYMSEVLNKYTFPAKHINDFLKLPIPLKVTSSDIVNGGLVLQDKGSLALAIRSTLAIPAAFSPVIIDGKQLVDGGLDRNFPVQEVIDMGAQKVIGAYTGFRLFTEKEIENPMKLIYQTHAFRSLQDARQQMKKTDFLIDFTQPLFHYTTKDFYKYKEIVEIGEAEARKYLPQLKKIAEEQRRNGVIYQHQLVKEMTLPVTKYNFYNENGTKVASASEIKMIRSLLDMPEGKHYTEKEVSEGISRIYGTRFYDKVYYTHTFTDSAGLVMNIFLKRGRKGSFKAAAYFDTDQSAGVLLNYTYRNLLLNRSRLMATIDFAERFKGRVNYYKFLDNRNKLWLKPALEWRSYKSNDIIIKASATYYTFNESDYYNSNAAASFSIGYSFNKSAMLEAGLAYEVDFFKRRVGKTSVILFPELAGSKYLYEHSNAAYYVRFLQNNLSSRYYPKSGNKLTAELKYFTNNQYFLMPPPETDSIGNIIYQILDPNSYGASAPRNTYRFLLNEQFALPLFKNLSLNSNLFYGFNMPVKNSNVSNYTYINQQFMPGGYDINQSYDNPYAIGLKSREMPAQNLVSFTAGLQYSPVKNFYITPLLSQIAGSWKLSGEYDYRITGVGIDFGYLSIIGPVKLNFSYSNAIGGWRGFFSFGHKF